MFGYARKDWRPLWDGWVYVDTVERRQPAARGVAGAEPADGGRTGRRRGLRHRTACSAKRSSAPTTSRARGVVEGLERVKRLPASSGHDGTTMGFGTWDHGALKGPYLVLRSGATASRSSST